MSFVVSLVSCIGFVVSKASSFHEFCGFIGLMLS